MGSVKWTAHGWLQESPLLAPPLGRAAWAGVVPIFSGAPLGVPCMGSGPPAKRGAPRGSAEIFFSEPFEALYMGGDDYGNQSCPVVVSCVLVFTIVFECGSRSRSCISFENVLSEVSVALGIIDDITLAPGETRCVL